MGSNAGRKEQREIRRAKGLCLTLYCRRLARPNRVMCFECAVKHAERRMKRYNQHKNATTPTHSDSSPS